VDRAEANANKQAAAKPAAVPTPAAAPKAEPQLGLEADVDLLWEAMTGVVCILGKMLLILSKQQKDPKPCTTP
jgi:hypothetical protein